MTTRVTHIKYAAGSPNTVYIGRAYRQFAASIWGNPFHMRGEEDRAAVIEKYRTYLLGKPELLARLPELKDKTLLCFCAPKACHGDVLVEMVNALDAEAIAS